MIYKLTGVAALAGGIALGGMLNRALAQQVYMHEFELNAGDVVVVV